MVFTAVPRFFGLRLKSVPMGLYPRPSLYIFHTITIFPTYQPFDFPKQQVERKMVFTLIIVSTLHAPFCKRMFL